MSGSNEEAGWSVVRGVFMVLGALFVLSLLVNLIRWAIFLGAIGVVFYGIYALFFQQQGQTMALPQAQMGASRAVAVESEGVTLDFDQRGRDDIDEDVIFKELDEDPLAREIEALAEQQSR